MNLQTSELRNTKPINPAKDYTSYFYAGHRASVAKKYERLKQESGSRTKYTATYVWIDGSGESMRSKMCTTYEYESVLEPIKIWEFDGSSTQQAPTEDSDLYLYPRAQYRDPFRPFEENKLVMCEVLDANKKPVKSNYRSHCVDVLERASRFDPWFGFEQEYVLLNNEGFPLGWVGSKEPPPQGPYYCSVGANVAFGREVNEAVYNCLLYAGISVFGQNAEVLPGQWEYQIGTCEGIKGPDELWMSRYILYRVAEDFGLNVTLKPKPVSGNWNGTGCHANFSTREMRETGGIHHIKTAIERLSKKHNEHLCIYDPSGGIENRKRLNGSFETQKYTTFTWAVSGRSNSVRIPRLVNEQGKGYFEDRRPPGNCDPYRVAAAITEAVCL